MSASPRRPGRSRAAFRQVVAPAIAAAARRHKGRRPAASRAAALDDAARRFLARRRRARGRPPHGGLRRRARDALRHRGSLDLEDHGDNDVADWPRPSAANPLLYHAVAGITFAALGSRGREHAQTCINLNASDFRTLVSRRTRVPQSATAYQRGRSKRGRGQPADAAKSHHSPASRPLCKVARKQTMRTKQPPQENELKEACQSVSADHPDFGVKRVFKNSSSASPAGD